MTEPRQKSHRSLYVIVWGVFSAVSMLHAQESVPNEYIVKLRAGLADSIVQILLSKKAPAILLPAARQPMIQRAEPIFSGQPTARVNAKSSILPLQATSAPIALRFKFSDSRSPGIVIAELEKSPFVEYAQPNYLYKLDRIPNDSAFSSQWSLERIGIVQFWASGFFDQSLPVVRVGVLDTGVDYLHPEMASRIYINYGETGLDQFGRDKRTNGIDDDGNGFVDDWRGYDFVDATDPDRGDWSTPDNDPMDENGHGTAVAGIIGAEPDNSIGIAGIAPCARIVPLRAFNAAGFGSDADIAAGLAYAADNGVQILNMSFGDVILSPLLRDMIAYAHSKNMVLVASSGNDGTSNPHYPSDFSDVISVGSVSQSNVRSFFSSYSPSLAMVAPGEGIPTIKLGGGYDPSFSGTSAAAPHVSGVAALLIAQDLANKATQPGSILLSNDEIRSNLLSSCKDLGDKGWDNFYGAGLLDALVLLSHAGRNVVQILSPKNDAQISKSIIPVVGNAATAQLDSVILSFGQGDSPTSWNTIAAFRGRQFINDTLSLWNVSSLNEGIYVLRLQVINIQTGEIESRVRLYLQRSNPLVLNFSYKDSAIVQDHYGAIVSFRVDRLSTTRLLSRLHGSTGAFREMTSPGLQRDHSFLLTPQDFPSGAQFDFYLVATDAEGKTVRFPTKALVGTDEYTVSIADGIIPSTGFTELPASLPSGFVLNRIDTIGGKKVFVLNEYDATGSFGKLKAFQYQSGAFVAIDSAERRWVPRDLRDVFHDGRLSTLVQDHGVTKLFTSNGAGSSFFTTETFVDSADVWGSGMYDFDGDGKLDLIARNSSQYLVYRNLGEKSFQLMARLDNPTKPFPGDARNQFGPPKSIVGDFSGTGNAEIVFADYDGDVLMYRQVNKLTAPFQFHLVWSDTSDLVETSDYVAAGDFDGDGRADFAVMGHSNLDINADGEYDAPTWRVRIFSHRASDPLDTFSTIWDQTLYGVKVGFSYDNGISAARIFSVPREQLILTLNPYLYVFDYDSTSRNMIPRWTHLSNSNDVLVSDLNGNGVNEFGFNSEGKTKFFERTSLTTKPQTPWSVALTPLAPKAIRVQWSSSDPSAVHKVYRDTVPQVHSLLASVAGTSFTDTTVSLNTRYWYAASQLKATESDLSTSVSTFTHQRARIDSVLVSAANQITLTMSFTIDPKRLSTAGLIVDDSLSPTSIALRSPSKLLVTLSAPISPDSHSVRIGNLFDSGGMQADTTQRVRFPGPKTLPPIFYVRQISFSSASIISVEFNDTVSSSALTVANYGLSNSIRSFSLKNVILDSLSKKRVYVALAENERISPVGFRIELRASEKILNIHGEPLNQGKGQTMSLAPDIANLDGMIVFPNPLRYSSGDALRNHLTFANVPQHCRIDIFEPQGKKIVTLEGDVRADGIRWNLDDERGRGVASGIYVFYATMLDENSNTVQTKTGKFAIIR